MIPSSAVIDEAVKFKGQPYVFAAEIDAKPDDYIGPVDCSELVQHACRRAGVMPRMPDGAYWQWLHSRHLQLPVEEARRTHGALMFMGDGVGTGRDAIFHVGFSLGDGRTFEARSASYGVGYFEKRGGWTFAAKIPGVDHSQTSPIPPRPPIPPAIPIKEYLAMAPCVYDLSGIVAYVDLVYQRWGRGPGQDLKGRMSWINAARESDNPGGVLTSMVVALTEKEGERP